LKATPLTDQVLKDTTKIDDQATPAANPSAVIRIAEERDLEFVIALDERNTGVPKPTYWRDLFERFAASARPRYFLVAEADGRFAGFIIGEVRAWEFGSEPCGWIFAIGVEPEVRLTGIGSRLLDALCARFKSAGVTKLRTMLGRDNSLIMSFFRSQGMMAGPFVQLEKDLA
jgi:ribosomal protein S18 acetylase RimI-like enzyme